MNPDIRRIFLAQALRAFAYGFGAVLLGVSLEANGWSSGRVGVLLTCIVAGTALMSIAVGTLGDRIGRRRFYLALFLALAAAGAVFALTDEFWVLVAVALAGPLSTDVVESGPFTSLEQAMLPSGVNDSGARTRVFGNYNAIATVAGSFGALAAGGPALLRDAIGGFPADQRFFLVFVPAGVIGALVASTLSGQIEVEKRPAGPSTTLPPQREGSTGLGLPLRRSRATVLRLCGLVLVDSGAGGFVVQSFIAYWFRVKYDVSTEALGAVFFVVGMLQSASFIAATRIAERIGLLNTMVFTHLPSNLFLAAIPLAPSFPVAMALLFGRFALSQMDVPTRQAYIAALVDPEERTAAAAYTNTARYTTRPLGPVLGGFAQQITLGLPFFIGGGLKCVYDVAVWAWFRRVPVDAPTAVETPQRRVSAAAEPPVESPKGAKT